jgi:16S rRNA (guanine527-N7)-methyltransferase
VSSSGGRDATGTLPTAPEPPPSTARTVFGENFDRACRYADLLCTDGVTRGLIGPREPGRIWSRHLLNAAALAPSIPLGARVLDIGSGAGLPGIPLALARPDLTMTLVEPMLRRAQFCVQAGEALGIELHVLRVRAQQLPVASADVVVARAVAPLVRLLPITVPLLRPGGVVLALKGAHAAQELADARAVLADLSAGDATIHAISAGDDRTYVVHVPVPGEAIRCADGAGSERGRHE